MKVTMRHGNGRANHNTRHDEKGEHIDAERTCNNVYVANGRVYAGNEAPDFHALELDFYERNFANYIADRNERAIQSRHPGRVTTPEQLLKDKPPTETILQIGSLADDPRRFFASEAEYGQFLQKCTSDYLKALKTRFGANLHVLDVSLHMDESSPHIHLRTCTTCTNKRGMLIPEKNGAYKEMGLELPHPEKKENRFNNRQMTFSAECREIFQTVVRERARSMDIPLELNTVPEHGKKHLSTLEYKVQQETKKLKKARELAKTPEFDRLIEQADLQNRYEALTNALERNGIDPQKLLQVPQKSRGRSR